MNAFRIQCVTLYMVFLTLLVYPLAATAASTRLPQDTTKAVILAYHRIGEDHLAEQSLTKTQFDQHIEELQNGKYNVLPLNDVITAISNNTPLPPRTVALTFEGAYASALNHAAPLLLKHNIPFTVFYASDTLDQKDPSYATWKQLKSLAKHENITMATLPASYTHTAHIPRQEALASLNKARQRYREEFKKEVAFLSYPYGEYSLELKELAKSQGFKAAFGMHSGAAYAGADLYALPRFSMTDPYGDIERFRMVTNALPLPASEIEPKETLLTGSPFFTGFTLPPQLETDISTLACFISGLDKPQTELLGSRVEIRATETLQHLDRIRLNCTMPGPPDENDEIQWRWFGILYHRPESTVDVSNSPQPDALPQPQE